MGIIQTITNELKAAIGYQQSFDELLTAGDVTRAVAMLSSRSEVASRNLLEYEVSSHKVMERKDRAVFDKRAISYAGASATRYLSPIRNSSMRLPLCSCMADL